MVFSETMMVPTSDYPQVITHEMENVTCDEIMSRANELKEFILQQKELILKTQRQYYATYGRFHKRLTEDHLESWIKLILNSRLSFTVLDVQYEQAEFKGLSHKSYSPAILTSLCRSQAP